MNYTKKDLHNPDNHDGVITHLESDILECEVKWALKSITMNKATWKCCPASSKVGFLSLGPSDILNQIILCCGACPLQCRMLTGIPSLYPVDVCIRAPQIQQPKMSLLLLSHFSRVRLFATPWTAAHQAPLSMGFSRQEWGATAFAKKCL